MTNETRKRIRAYKKALPELRERVAAVALLLAMSVSMLASASFAWLTLSAAPEIVGMQTTVAANGNLEIALAHGPTSKEENGVTVKANAIAPGDSQVGDSSAAKDQSIVEANITWGNLVNLSDPSYGLDMIALRPALISDNDLDEYPLYGATYGGDGRVIETGEQYEYSSWKDFGEGVAYFVAGPDTQYGVRAIASTTAENVAGNVTVKQYQKNIDDAYKEATRIYTGMITNDREAATKLTGGATCIEALDGLVTVFAQDKVYEILGSDTTSSCSPYLYNFYEMLVRFRAALDEEGKALLNMANWQAYNSSEDGKTDTFKSIEDLKSKVNKLGDYGVTLTTLAGHITDYNNLQKAISSIETKAKECHPDIVNKPKYTYDDISEAVSYLVDIGSTTLDGAALGTLGFSNISTILSSSTKNIVIKKGILTNFEERVINNTDRMYVYMEVTVTDVPLFGTRTVKGNVFTKARNAGDPTRFADMSACEDNSGSKSRAVNGTRAGSGEEVVAKDTYGMAIDVWVRTNYPEAVLTLDGSPVYKDEVVTDVDNENKTVDLYVITVDEVEVDVYQKNGKWFYAREHSEVPAESMGEQTPVQKTKQVMVGYQGENRIWSDWETLLEQGYIEKDATTQGAGSCFVFYADPTEQTKILDMLGSFTVVFCNQKGKSLGTARLNIENYYSNQGKVIVPLEMVTGQEYTDESGENHVGILKLTQNTPEMITSIIYLNGKRLENENVLADGKLQGQLNIQFGTSTTLVAPGNEELQSQYRTITAEVTVGSQISTNKDKPITLEYAENGHNAHVKLIIDGEQPERIRGFFVRVINATQGTRGEEKEFTMNPETGEWTADFTLTAPGNYVFNTVTVDGIQYTLHDGSDEDHLANQPSVYIDGLKLESVSTDKSNGTYLQTEGAFPIKVTAKVNSVVEPKQVTALFVNASETKQFTALMSYDEGNKAWVGTANITSSDTYILRNIIVDENPLDIPVQNQTTVTLYLGLKTGVYTTLDEGNWNFKMLDQNGDGDLDVVTVPLYVRVWNGNTLMNNLSNVTLYYHSSISHMDSDGYEIPLTWSNVNGEYYYAGEMGVDKLGTFQFDRLSVSLAGQSSPIYELISAAPAFTGYSPEPPEYDRSHADPYQLAISKDAQYFVQLEHHENAQSVTGTFNRVDATGTHTETLTTSTKETGTGAFIFNLDKDGEWKLTNLHVVAYSGEIDLEPTDEVKTTVVKTPYATVTGYNGPKELNGIFLEEQSTGKVTISVTDYAGRPIDALDSATWSFNHIVEEVVDGKLVNIQKEYGGYTDTNGKAVKVNKTQTLTKETDGVVSGEVALTFAGKYESTITLIFEDGHTWNLKDGNGTLVKPTYLVKSAKPTVTVTGVTPGVNQTFSVNSHASAASGGGFTEMSSVKNHFSDYYATVYIQYTGATLGTWRNYAEPSVELTLSDVVSTFTDASITFNHPTPEYARTYTFTPGNGMVRTNEIGHADSSSLTDANPKLYYGGKQSASQITVTYGDATLVADLSHEVTINQPQYPLYVDFASTGTNGMALPTTPSRIYGVPNKDGVFEITLPATQPWTQDMSTTENEDFVQQGDPTNRDVFTQREETTGSGCNTTTTTYYTPYIETTTIYKADGFTTTWTRTYSISGWKIGSTTYQPGETVQITSNQTVTAVVGHTDSTKITNSSTTTRTVIEYTLNGVESTSKPDGAPVQNVTNSTVETVS